MNRDVNAGLRSTDVRTGGDRPGAVSGAADPVGDSSIGELVSQVVSDVGDLLSTQVELAKVELREEAARAGQAAKLLGAGAAAGYFAALVLTFAAAWALAEWWDSPALGFLAIGLMYAVVAAVLLLRGRDRVKEVRPVPDQTIETLKEDVQWAKQQAS